MESLTSTIGTAVDPSSSGRIAQKLGKPNDDISDQGASEYGTVSGLEREAGRLLFEKGESRYVNEGFWASVDYEVRLLLHLHLFSITD